MNVVKGHALVAGTGQMAEEIGLLLLKHGYQVTWISRDQARAAEFQARMVRLARRAAKATPGLEEGFRGSLGIDELDRVIPPLTADLLIETTAETEKTKQEILERLEPRLRPDVPMFSNSSSILPGTLHPRCIGVHFFRPVVLTGFVEAVFPRSCSDTHREWTRHILTDLGLCWIEQNESQAFAANRLLLPIQAECFRLLMAGHAPAEVNLAGGLVLFPLGQLTMMDAIGLDVVSAGVEGYLARMAPEMANDLQPLVDGLAQLLALGKRGNKNGNGLLRGTPLPWADLSPTEALPLTDWLSAVTINACALAVDTGMLSRKELDVILDRVFQIQLPAFDGERDAAHRSELLARRYQETGIWYYRPALARWVAGEG